MLSYKWKSFFNYNFVFRNAYNFLSIHRIMEGVHLTDWLRMDDPSKGCTLRRIWGLRCAQIFLVVHTANRAERDTNETTRRMVAIFYSWAILDKPIKCTHTFRLTISYVKNVYKLSLKHKKNLREGGGLLRRVYAFCLV